MNPIQILPLSVQNQIAAGEVVERPASVLKELLDNAVDACATQIDIEIASGGTALIRVTDNGQGIAKEQLPLAIMRHATSKITKISDLDQLESMGFRGEALASIASVSRFRLQSKTSATNLGAELSLDGREDAAEMKNINHPTGTSVIVRDLFFNVPVRREFLKSEKMELRQINDMIRRFVLIHATIGFSLTLDGRKKWDLAPAHNDMEYRLRLQKFMPDHFDELSQYHETQDQWVKIRGYCAPPDISRAQADFQFLFVNNRPIRDQKLAYAVRRAYQDLMFGQRHGIYCIWIDLPPSEVDVNVHPRKSEVRFKHPELIYTALYRFSNRAVNQPIAPKLSIATPALRNQSQVIQPSSDQIAQKLTLDSFQSAPFLAKPKVNPMYQSSFVHTEVPKAVAQMPEVGILGYAIGQLQGIYVLAQNEQGLVVVDMHAAHERILLERYKKQYDAQGIARQNLLIAVDVKVTDVEMNTYQAYSALIKHMGFTVHEKEDGLTLTQVPVDLNLSSTALAFKDLISDLHEHGLDENVQQNVLKILANICCHRAVRKMRQLSLPEMNQLLREIEQTERSSYCNHGRPTWSVISINDLDKYFHRGE